VIRHGVIGASRALGIRETVIILVVRLVAGKGCVPDGAVADLVAIPEMVGGMQSVCGGAVRPVVRLDRDDRERMAGCEC
jgi:hypothetical protein